jgi:hypothetical protein
MSDNLILRIDRDGNQIDEETWLDLYDDDSYRRVRLFDNGDVRVQLNWLGTLSRAERRRLRETWPVYLMTVKRLTKDGVVDYSLPEHTFPDEESAIQGYEEYLTSLGVVERYYAGGSSVARGCPSRSFLPSRDIPQTTSGANSGCGLAPW